MSSSLLSENIKALRKVNRLKQQDIAKLAGASTTRISQIENGLVQPSASMLTVYTSVFNCSYEFLYTRDVYLQQFLMEIRQKTIDRNYDQEFEQLCLEMMNRYEEHTIEQDIIKNVLGKLYLYQGAYKKAYRYFHSIYENKRNEMAWNYMNHLNLALTCYHLRRYDRAIVYLDELDTFYNYHGNLEDKYRIVHLRGSISIQQGNFEAAEQLFKDLLEYAKNKGKFYEELSAIHNIGYNFLMQKKYKKAAFQLALASSKAYAENHSYKICEITVDLSQCYIDMGEYSKAEKIISAAMEHGKDNYVETRLKLNLARCKQDSIEKLTLLNAVCMKAEKMNYPVLQKDIYKYLGKTHSVLGNLKEAVIYFENALKICETL